MLCFTVMSGGIAIAVYGNRETNPIPPRVHSDSLGVGTPTFPPIWPTFIEDDGRFRLIAKLFIVYRRLTLSILLLVHTKVVRERRSVGALAAAIEGQCLPIARHFHASRGRDLTAPNSGHLCGPWPCSLEGQVTSVTSLGWMRIPVEFVVVDLRAALTLVDHHERGFQSVGRGDDYHHFAERRRSARDRRFRAVHFPNANERVALRGQTSAKRSCCKRDDNERSSSRH